MNGSCKVGTDSAATDHSVCTDPATSCSTASCGDTSQRQIALCVLENFCEIFLSAIEFCRSNKSHKFCLI